MYKTTRYVLAAVGLDAGRLGRTGPTAAGSTRITLPPVEVTAQRNRKIRRRFPLSVTVMLRGDG